jgi:TadE-like protein
MGWMSAGEEGQGAIELALVFIIAVTLTLGALDGGRAFYQYNAVSSAARFGARWAGVIGGTCNIPGRSTSDWCSQLGNTSVEDFWQQSGTVPLQGNGKLCPTFASAPADYYNVGSFVGSSNTTIVGAMAQHFDSSTSSTSFVRGILPGLDLSKLRVCIQTSNTAKDQIRGDYVLIEAFYHFVPVNFLIATGGIDLTATSQYVVEG